ncbi:MAG: hypothetical protein ACOYJZ_08745 [Acutalibacter sp.]|jgi:hypothetical protein
MIRLTDKLAVVADTECYIVGVPVEPEKESGGKRSKAPKVRSPRYYPTLAQAVRGAVSTTLRQKVALEEITTLSEFIRQEKQLQEEFTKRLEDLEA